MRGGTRPLVSICCTTYNHARYLEQALDGFLAQKCAFPCEILVHDDASTDGTADILADYAARYPDVIFPLYEAENQYSRGVPINETFNFPRARGKYIALCEGDDYWSEDTKLARQIAHMEGDPGCTFCFTNGLIHDESGKAPDRPFLPYYPEDRALYTGKSRAYTLSEMAAFNFIPTASFVFRVDALRSLPPEFTGRRCEHGDLRMKLYLTACGHAWYEHVLGCVYRQNVSGSAMQIWQREDRARLYARCRSVVEMAEDVNRFSHGEAEEALQKLKDHYLRIMAHNAPDLRTLREGDVGRVYRSLPALERLRCTARFKLPAGILRLLGKGGKP